MRRALDSNWLIFGLLGLIWGSSYLFIKIGVESLGPFTLVSLRLLFATLFLGAVAIAVREPIPRSPRVLVDFVALGLFSVVVPFSLITWGEIHVASGLASVLNAATPLFTILFAAVLLRDEPIRLNRLIGLLVGFAGVVVVIVGGIAVVKARRGLSRTFRRTGGSAPGRMDA